MKNVIASGNTPKRNIIVEIIASLLLIFFVHTLISSYIQLQSLKNLLAFYTKNTTGVAWGMIATELLISVILFIRQTRNTGFILVVLFSAFGFYMVITHLHYPNDFGGIANQLSSTQLLILYSLLFVLSLSGLISGKRRIKSKIKEEPSVVFT